MAKKRTPEDHAFALRFTAALLEKWRQEIAADKHTDATFAESVGITRPQLFHYRQRPQVPSVRTIALAFKNHKILVPYGRTDLRRIVRGGAPIKADQQLLLPLVLMSKGKKPVAFSVTGVTPGQLEVMLSVSPRRRSG